jgi:hypothetical protein
VASSISMKALQRADQLLGLAACAALQPARWVREREAEYPAKRVLAIKFWGIGSLQLLTPAIATLRRRHPFAEITFLTLAGNARVRRAAGRLRPRLSRSTSRARAGCASRAHRALLCASCATRFDVVYDFEFFTRFSSLVSLLTRAPRRHGFESPSVWRGRFHTDTIVFNRYWHVARNFRALAGGEDGLNVDGARRRRTALRRARRGARGRLRARTPASASRRLTSCSIPTPASCRSSAAGPRRTSSSSRSVSRREDWCVVLIGSAAEREYVDTIAARVGVIRAAQLAGELSTPELGGAVRALGRGRDERLRPDAHRRRDRRADARPLRPGDAGDVRPARPARARAVPAAACSPCINVHDNKVASCIYGEPQCLVALDVDEVHEAAHALALERRFDLERRAPSRRPRTPRFERATRPRATRGRLMRVECCSIRRARIYIRDYFCSKTTKSNYLFHPIDLVMLSGIVASKHETRCSTASPSGSRSTRRARIDAFAPDAIVSLVGSVSWDEDRVFLAAQAARGRRVIAIGDVLHENADVASWPKSPGSRPRSATSSARTCSRSSIDATTSARLVVRRADGSRSSDLHRAASCAARTRSRARATSCSRAAATTSRSRAPSASRRCSPTGAARFRARSA